MTPPRETPPAPSLGEIAERVERAAREGRFDYTDGLAFASHLRSVADVLGTLPDVRLGWHDYPAACIAFVARLRTALSDHQGGGE